MADLIPIGQRRGRYRTPPIEQDLCEALRELREFVENQGTGRSVLVNGVYRTRSVDTVFTTEVFKPWVIGYQVKEIPIMPGFFERYIYVKHKDCKNILDIPEAELEPIYGAIYNSLIDPGAEFPEFEQAARDTVRMRQRFSVVFWHEGNPNIRVPNDPKTRYKVVKNGEKET